MDQPCTTTQTNVQEETARHGTTSEDSSSEDRFYAQLSRGASSLMLRPSSSLEPLGHSAASNEQQEVNKAKEASKEEEEDTDVEEDRPSRHEVDKGKEDEEEEEAVGGDADEVKRKADQMRRDEELARQLQIQYLREVAGADPELLQQLNALVQQEASAALNESSPAVLDNAGGAAELIECAICCEEKKLQEIYTYYQCGHRYCVECLKEYYGTHIREGDVKLRCPYPGCSTAVLPVQVAAVVDGQLLQKYKQFAWYDEVKTNPNTRWCTKPGCETVLVRPDSGETKVVCSGCGTVTCFLCGDEWHEGASCEDNRKRKIEAGLADTTVEDYAKQQNVNVRICPRCAVPIEKNKGCNTMTCSFCSCSFCWLCGQVMTPHHFSQKGPCKGKDGEAKWLKALVYTILAGMIVTLPVWAGPAYVVYKVKQHKRKRVARAAEAAASAPAQNS